MTTIKVSEKLKDYLKKRKISPSESYEDVIWDLIEDSLVIKEEAKQDIYESKDDYEQRKTISLKELKEEHDL